MLVFSNHFIFYTSVRNSIFLRIFSLTFDFQTTNDISQLNVEQFAFINFQLFSKNEKKKRVDFKRLQQTAEMLPSREHHQRLGNFSTNFNELERQILTNHGVLFIAIQYLTYLLSEDQNMKKIKDVIQYYHCMIREQPPFKGNSVKIVNGQWTKEVTACLNNTSRWAVRHLSLQHNERATVVKEIAHINFTALTQLDLVGNKIKSIEGLPRVGMPHITILNLSNNSITSVSGIKKAFWPALQFLNNNNFGDAYLLTEGRFLKLQTLWVYDPWMDGKKQFTDHCFPFKMQAPSLLRLYIGKDTFSFYRSEKFLPKKLSTLHLQ